MLRPITTAAVIAALLLFALPVAADDEVEVGSCLRLLAQEKAPQGLRMVSSDIKTLLLMKEAVYSFTLFAGNTYTLQTCSGANVADVDIHLYGQDGTLVEAKTEVDRQPTLTIKPEKTGTFYLVVKLIDTTDAKPGAVGYVQLYE